MDTRKFNGEKHANHPTSQSDPRSTESSSNGPLDTPKGAEELDRWTRCRRAANRLATDLLRLLGVALIADDQQLAADVRRWLSLTAHLEFQLLRGWTAAEESAANEGALVPLCVCGEPSIPGHEIRADAVDRARPGAPMYPIASHDPIASHNSRPVPRDDFDQRTDFDASEHERPARVLSGHVGNAACWCGGDECGGGK